MGVIFNNTPHPLRLFVYCLLLSTELLAQPKVIIGVLLPLETNTSSKIFNDKLQNIESHSHKTYQINEQVNASFSFLEGLMRSKVETDSNSRWEIKVFDTGLGDSLLPDIWQHSKKELAACRLIIGPVSNYGARLAAEFCKENKIYNIQPFSPSRSIGTDNPYLIKLNPGIDAIVENTFYSILDSFRQAQVILYAPAKGVEGAAAMYLDSLIKNDPKAQKTGISSKLCLIGGEKKGNIIDILATAKNPVVVSTSLNLSWVQGILKPLAGKSVPLYGMPNWLQSEIIRLDYLNDCSTRIPDFFDIDSTNSSIYDFTAQYLLDNGVPPDRSAWLGKDVGDFCISLFDNTGDINLQEGKTFHGLAHQFRLTSRVKNSSILFWENSYCPIFQITDYLLRKVH